MANATNSNMSMQSFAKSSCFGNSSSFPRIVPGQADGAIYKVGETGRAIFDKNWTAFQKLWKYDNSVELKERVIILSGLKEFSERFEAALVNINKNPNDANALEKIKSLATHYADFLNPIDTPVVRAEQKKYFQPLEERIAKLAPRIKGELQKIVPTLCNENAEQIESKIYIPFRQNPRWPSSIDLSTLNGENGFKISGNDDDFKISGNDDDFKISGKYHVLYDDHEDLSSSWYKIVIGGAILYGLKKLNYFVKAYQARREASAEHQLAENQRLQSILDNNPGLRDQLESHNEFLCPINREIMLNPVSDKSGVSYERSAIITWISNYHSSPTTRERLEIEDLRPNLALKSMIQAEIDRYQAGH